MNYLKIYEQLIEHRKTLPKLDSEYYERHHIVPKCLGGEGSSENLIYLSAEDHFVAHLLLAHIHGGKLWFAANAMRMETAGRLIKNRSTFALMKKKHSENVSGENNWAYDHTLYTVINIDTLVEFTGKRLDIQNYLKTSDTAICLMLDGTIKSTKNHCFKDSLHLVKRKDQTLYELYHLPTKQKVTGTYYQIADDYCVTRKHIKYLVEEKMHEAYGFILLKNFQEVKYINTLTGEIFTSTPEEMCAKYGISSAHYYAIKSKEGLTAKGIAIHDVYISRKSQEIVYTIEDILTKDIYSSTRQNLIDSGRINADNFRRISSGVQKTAKGLRILSKSEGTWH